MAESASAPQSLEARHHFLLRRLHSLSGIVPIGAFLIEHMLTNSMAAYGGREDDLPVDAHLLLALAAPRPLYVASASEDLWADPRGEFLGALHAEPVYALFGRSGLGVREMPPADTSVGAFIGYHVRTGKHDITAFDWDQYLRFADRHLSPGSR